MTFQPSHFDVLDGNQSSRQIADAVGLEGYELVAQQHPDETIGYITERAARIGMIASGRFDADPHAVAQRIADSITSSFPTLEEDTEKVEKEEK